MDEAINLLGIIRSAVAAMLKAIPRTTLGAYARLGCSAFVCLESFLKVASISLPLPSTWSFFAVS